MFSLFEFFYRLSCRTEAHFSRHIQRAPIPGQYTRYILLYPNHVANAEGQNLSVSVPCALPEAGSPDYWRDGVNGNKKSSERFYLGCHKPVLIASSLADLVSLCPNAGNSGFAAKIRRQIARFDRKDKRLFERCFLPVNTKIAEYLPLSVSVFAKWKLILSYSPSLGTTTLTSGVSYTFRLS